MQAGIHNTCTRVKTRRCNARIIYASYNAHTDIKINYIRGRFEKFVDWRQCAAVMQREAVTVMPSYSGGGKEVVA
jgi:hypothetical protein